MDTQKAQLFFLIFFLLSTPSSVIGSGRLLQTDVNGDETSDLRTYIIHVQKPEGGHDEEFAGFEDRKSWHESFLPISAANSNVKRLTYSYDTAISGFAARLTQEELAAMEKMEGFVDASPDQLLDLQTTHSPAFLGLNQENGFWSESNFGEGVIIGMVDSGIFPSHPSFSDEGMPPPPSRWKGRCDFNHSACNKKVIGGRRFISWFKATGSPVDLEGHGTHTASTAAGSFVKNANVLGNAKGTAVGIAPRAHIAVYKVCMFGGCLLSDVLAGVDQAIADGVDVISLSLGGPPSPFYVNNIAISSLAAVEKGVFVSCAAGNSGPTPGIITNVAPWILTVGASTMDRAIRATVKIGNGEEFDGESLYQPRNSSPAMLPLVYPGANGEFMAETCANGSLDSRHVRGKAVLCFYTGYETRIGTGEIVKSAGGAAMILVSPSSFGSTIFPAAHVLPASEVTYSDGLKIQSYFNSSSAPTAAILSKGTVFGVPSSPAVAFFSSRGPSAQSPGILKPDLIGPGVNVLAAWPIQVGPISSSSSSTSTFNIISGTSMSTPHLSGIAALLKSSHPDWSPARIRSAMMTTSDVLNHDGKPITDGAFQDAKASVLAIGAGHVNPSKANDPGLVYDLVPDDYISYLCTLGYTDKQVNVVARRRVTCSNTRKITREDLNYPSFSVSLGSSRSKTVQRIVTNVGEGNSVYSVEIDEPTGVSVKVNPMKLYFSKVNQKAGFKVSLSRSGKPLPGSSSEGHLRWVSDKYAVRSPISVTFK